MAYCWAKPQCARVKLFAHLFGLFESTGTESGMALDWVAREVAAAAGIPITCDAREWETVEDLSIRPQSNVGAKDIMNRSVEELAVILVEDRGR